MSQALQDRFVAITDKLVRILPIWAIVNSAIAFGASRLGHANNILLWGLATATTVGGVLVLTRFQFGAKGMRPWEEEGFSRFRDFANYAVGSRGYSRHLVFLLVGLLLVTCIVTTESDGRIDVSAASALAFASFWAVGVVVHFTRRWPADEPQA